MPFFQYLDPFGSILWHFWSSQKHEKNMFFSFFQKIEKFEKIEKTFQNMKFMFHKVPHKDYHTWISGYRHKSPPFHTVWNLSKSAIFWHSGTTWFHKVYNLGNKTCKNCKKCHFLTFFGGFEKRWKRGSKTGPPKTPIFHRLFAVCLSILAVIRQCLHATVFSLFEAIFGEIAKMGLL